jgi:hypothetical protein
MTARFSSLIRVEDTKRIEAEAKAKTKSTPNG